MPNEDVVVIGAGPVGLMLAIELAVAGARVTVLERLTAPDETIKAGGMGALAGEALERRGLGPAMAAEERSMFAAMAALRGKAGAIDPRGKPGGHFAGLTYFDRARPGEPERPRRGVAQQPLERMLGERARTLGVDIRRGHTLTSFADRGDGVVVEAESDPGPVTIHCRFLVGCDGGRSAVRKRAGIDFPGTDPTLTGYQAIVTLDHPEKLLPLGWRRTNGGMLAYGPLPGRVCVIQFDGPPIDRGAPVTMAEVEASLRRVSGADVRVLAMQPATRFTDNARQATTYRKGSVLLAGDAAHVHSPFGGHGLNLGLLDAVNLGWKLAAVARGAASETLLDTYTDERHPVAARALASTRAQIALMRSDALTGALRDLVTELLTLDEVNRFISETMSGVAARYPLGSAHPLVGTLAANRALVGETSLYERMSDGSAVLVAAGSAGANVPPAPRLHVARSTDGPSMLVRPDGAVAWASDDDDASGLDEALARWCFE